MIIDSGIECAPNSRLPSLQLAALRELPGGGADHGREQLEVVVGRPGHQRRQLVCLGGGSGFRRGLIDGTAQGERPQLGGHHACVTSSQRAELPRLLEQLPRVGAQRAGHAETPVAAAPDERQLDQAGQRFEDVGAVFGADLLDALEARVAHEYP